MIDLKFTEEDREILNYERFHHPHPRVQLKMEVLWLKSQNLPLNLICRLAKVSPNLNLIERLWKFVKKKCLYAKYYEDFPTFSSAISGCLNNAHLQHKKELDSLLTLRFQHFDQAQIMTV